MIAIGTLLLVVVLSLLITRVATAILTATGMSAMTARFQARSALTGTGFTTKEAEEVVNHPVRRKVVATLMLLGNAGVVAAASSTILGLKGGGLRNNGWKLLELCVGLLLLVIISRSKWIDARLNQLIRRLLRRFTDLEVRDLSALIDLAGDYSISELAIDPGDWLDGKTLGEAELRDEGVVVLGITRKDGRYVAAPIFRTVIQAGDVLVVYGHDDALCELDQRPAGDAGDAAHRHAVVRQEQLERTEETGSPVAA